MNAIETLEGAIGVCSSSAYQSWGSVMYLGGPVNYIKNSEAVEKSKQQKVC